MASLGERIYAITKANELAIEAGVPVTFTPEEAYLINKFIAAVLVAMDFSISMENIWKEFSTSDKEDKNVEEE